MSVDFPALCLLFCSIRHITAEVGAAVLRAAVAEDLAEGHCDVGPRELQQMSEVFYSFISHTAFDWQPGHLSSRTMLSDAGGDSRICHTEHVVPGLQPPCS